MILFYILLALCINTNLCALSIGSKSTVSSQAYTVFPAADSNNTMLGYAFFENGFSLESNLTTCTFDSFMPVSGNIDLNGGQLWLNEDLILSNTSTIRSCGRIYGNNQSIEMSNKVTDQVVPSSVSGASLYTNMISSVAMFAAIQTVDWSYDNAYIAAGSSGTSSGQEIKIYYFDGATLTTTQSVEQNNKDTYAVAWHPTKYFIAAGMKAGTGNEVSVYKLDRSNGSLNLTASLDFGSSGVYSLAWHQSGNYLVIGTLGSGVFELYVYSFNQTTGALTAATSLDLSPSRQIQTDALSFSPGGNRIAVGTASNSTAGVTEFLVCSFAASALTITTSADINLAVQSVDWSPTGTYIAIGLAAGTQTLRIYEHQFSPSERLIPLTTAYVRQSSSITCVSWNSTGEYLASAVSAGLSSSISIYYFNKVNKTLTLVNTIASSVAINAVRWSHDSNYLCYGDTARNVIVTWAGTTGRNPLVLDTSALVFNTDTFFTTNVYFVGNCKINGRGKRITIGTNGASLIVRPNSQLILEDVEIHGLKSNNLRCMVDNSSIILRNTMLSLDSDYTFSRGSILFEEDTIITGTNKFVYASKRTSTIASGKTLFLTQGVTFSYAPLRAKQDLLYMPDTTARLYLQGCTLYSTRTGLHLSRGTVIVDDLVTFSSTAQYDAEALCLNTNLDLVVRAGAQLDLFGIIKYQ